MDYVGWGILMGLLAFGVHRLHPKRRALARIQHDIQARIFSESPAHHMEGMSIQWWDGFFLFEADYIVVADDRLMPRSVSGRHNGREFLEWRVEMGDEASQDVLKKVYATALQTSV